jgi:hypothetical protein
MRRSSRARALLGLGVALAASSVLVAAVLAGERGRPRLPDLVQELPSGLDVSSSGSRWRLGFDSAVGNAGDGPLRIVGARPSRSVRGMSADQLVERAGGGGPERVPGVGRLRYVRASDHQHWHLLGFERYELRRVGARGVLVRDRKSGFCLGDRYDLPGELAAKPSRPAYESRCGLRRPRLLDLEQGISVGYGDDYPAHLEGQWLALDGLRSGRYVLVHRVDVERRLRERTRANNAASVLVSLRWRGGRPRVRVLKRCPGSGRCR